MVINTLCKSLSGSFECFTTYRNMDVTMVYVRNIIHKLKKMAPTSYYYIRQEPFLDKLEI